jgi:transcription elongation factor GreA
VSSVAALPCQNRGSPGEIPGSIREITGYDWLMDEVHLSRDAFERLQAELSSRTGEKRVEISVWIERAREHGDIRENADYDAAKNEQGHNEARIRQLEALLRDAIVVEGSQGDVVAPGMVVEVRMNGDDTTQHYLVGSIEERHDTYDVLSTSSPLGQALMGASPGQIVEYKGPRRMFEVEVVSVRSVDA